VLSKVNNKYCYAYSVLNNQSQYHNMNFTMFISQMGQPNFDSYTDSEPLHGICKIPYRTDSEEFIDIPFRTVPNFESQFRRTLVWHSISASSCISNQICFSYWLITDKMKTWSSTVISISTAMSHLWSSHTITTHNIFIHDQKTGMQPDFLRMDYCKFCYYYNYYC